MKTLHRSMLVVTGLAFAALIAGVAQAPRPPHQAHRLGPPAFVMTAPIGPAPAKAEPAEAIKA